MLILCLQVWKDHQLKAILSDHFLIIIITFKKLMSFRRAVEVQKRDMWMTKYCFTMQINSNWNKKFWAIQDSEKDKQFQVFQINQINSLMHVIIVTNHNIKLQHQCHSIILFIKAQLSQLLLVKHFKSLRVLEKDKLKMRKSK
jgi:hypothetical protein